MKTILSIAIIAIIINSGAAAQSIPNGQFEGWSNTNGYNIPDNWGTLNDMTSASGIYTATKGTSSGDSYLKLISQNVPGMGVMPGIAVSGNLNESSLIPVSGFPLALRPISLQGRYQYMANSPNDVGHIEVYLTKWNQSMGMRDTIGYILQDLNGMAMSWANFNIPFVYNLPIIPDSSVIILSASGDNPEAGSYLFIDNLDFFMGTTGIVNQQAADQISLYPNPTTDIFQLDISSVLEQVRFFQIIDAGGKVVLVQTSNGQPIQTFSIAVLPKGNYVFNIYTSQGVLSKSILKQ